MDIEFVNYLGEIRNDSEINGKSFIFKIIDNNEVEECILFVHPTIQPFVTIENMDSDIVLDAIMNKYNIKDLIEFKELDNEN